MNMISTGAFLNEMDASNKKETVVSKLVSAWEKKNAKVAKAGGVSLMALSLAACGSDSDDAAAVVTPTTPATPVTPAASTTVALANDGGSFSLSTTVDGVSVPASTAAKIYLNDNEPGDAYAFTLDAASAGSGTLVLEFADAGDTATLAADSSFGNFTALEIKNGTVDITAVTTASAITSVTINSGIIATAAQIQTISSLTGTGTVTIKASTQAEIDAAIAHFNTNNFTVATTIAASSGSSLTAADITAANTNMTAEVTGNTPVVVVEATPITLTTKLDTGGTFNGSAADDSINGTMTFSGDALTAAATLTAGDTLAGGDGTDTLTITVTGAAVTDAGEIAAPTLTGIEKVHVRSFETDASTNANAGANIQEDSVEIDLSNAIGVTEIGTTASNNVEADVVFANVSGLPSVVMAGLGDLRIENTTASVTALTDAVTVTLNDVGTAKATPSTLSMNGVETVTLNSKTAANFLVLANDGFTTVNVTGDKAINVDILDTGVTVVDASEATGAVYVDTDAITLANLTSVKGGQGSADTLVIDEAVTVDATPTNTLSKVSGFEILEVTGAVTTALSTNAAGINSFDFTDGTDQVLTLNSGYTGDTTVTIKGDATNADTITNSANVSLTVTANAADLDGTITGGTGTDTLNVTADGGTRVVASTITGIENINIVAAATPSSVVGLTMDNANVAALKTMTVDGSALTDTAAVFTFDGSAELDGQFIVTGGAGKDIFTAGAKGDTLDGGANDDQLTGGAGNDTLTGGAGKDTITMNAGVDTVTGGDGNDTIVAAGNLTAADTVDGGDGTDTLRVSALNAAALANVSNVENLQLTSAATASLTANLAFTTIDLTQGATTEAVTLATGYTATTTFKIDAGDDITNTAADATITVEANASDLEAGDNSLLAGSDKAGVINTLVITNDSAATVDMQTDISNFDVVTIKDNTVSAGVDITLDLTSYASIVDINASELDFGEDVTITGTSAAAITYTGGGGVDTVVLSSGKNDTITLGSGKDVITGSTNITYEDTIDAGDGVDTMTATSLNDIDLKAVSNLENLTIDNTSTLGAFASAAGVVQVTVTGGDSITSSGMTTGVTYVADKTAQSDTLTGGSGDDIFRFEGLTGLEDGDVINGTSGNDTIQMNNIGRMIAAVDIDDLTNIDQITAKDADGFSATQGDSVTLNILADASSVAHTFTIDMSAITDGNDDVIMTQAGTANTKTAYVITGGAGDDVLIASAAKDTISGGSGADKIDGGGAADTLTGGAGADTFQYSSGDAQFGSEDTITDFTTGTDKIEINVTNTNATFKANFNKSTTGVNMASFLTTNEDGEAVYDSKNGTLIVDLNGDGALGGNDIFVTSSAEIKAEDIVYNITSKGSAVETVALHSSATVNNGDDKYIVVSDTDSVTGAVDIIHNFDTANDIVVVTGTENAADNFKGALTAADLASGVLDDKGGGASLEIKFFTDAGSTVSTAFTVDNYQLGSATAGFTMAASSEVTGGNHADHVTGGATSAGVTLGQGADVYTGAGGTDTVIMTGSVGFGVDQIGTFTSGTDIIQIDRSDLIALSSVTALVNLDGGAVAGAVAAGSSVMSGNTKVTDLANADNDEILQINGDYDNAEEVETALEVGGANALIADGATWDAGDAFLIVYDDGITSTIAIAASSAAVANDATFAVGTITVTDIATFTGIADAGSATTLAAASVQIIA
jgi:Ca2+-binding RTX toxin-like protein